jgi:hypothetical protein
MKTRIKNLLLLLLGLPVMVQAQDAYSTNADGSIYAYSTNADGSANIVAYAGPPWVVTIPTNINGLTVTTIGGDAFAFTSLTSVTIPNSVTSIGSGAFAECTSLTNVSIPDSVTSIGESMFYDCTHLSVTIPGSVTSIGEIAFQSSGLTSVTIPDSVTSIGNNAFDDCTRLTSVTIPNSVTSIGFGAFDDCNRLTSVTIPNSVTNIGSGAFGFCTSLTSVTIGNSVTSIGDQAFEGCYSLTGVYFTGNSPSPTNDSTVFSGDPATVYYLPGTTGWGAMFDGLPTAPWFLPNPQILNNGPGFGVQPGGFGFTISWATNVSVVVEAATNLANPVWIPVSTNTLTSGTNYFSDPQWTNYPERFYRAAGAGAYTVGGTLTRLPAGDTVTLQDNGSDNLTLSANGTFTFPTALPNGHAYSVTVSGTGGATPLVPLTCTVTANGSGTISGANVTNVAVQCSHCPEFTGNMDEDMYNAAVADGTANGGVPAVMATENGGPFRVTARGLCTDNVCETYSAQCVVAQIVGTTSCSSTTLPSGTEVIQFGGALVCGGGPYRY